MTNTQSDIRELKFRAWADNLIYTIHSINFGLGNVEIWHKGPGTSYRNLKDVVLMQYTGLKDKNGSGQEVYEGDIISSEGKVVGNRYENPSLLQDESNLLVQGFGGEIWEATNKEAVARGCYYAKRYADSDAVRELEQLRKGGRV